ncbi:ROK family protein [Aquimarina longa]|uniref:ROK family protein n=1 Tax=Aquimarina longa TaxID=1080221 RepID=UPI000784D025|nr:ROK family protein [Aquimarina longa]
MIIGVTIGGNSITTTKIETKTNSILENTLVTIPIDNKADANTIIEQWICSLQKVISTFTEEEFLEGIGIAIPGPFDYHNGIFAFKMNQKYTSLFCINIKEIIVKKLQLTDHIPVRFYNDAACFGIGEVWKGKLKTIQRGLGIILDTGFGATFLYHGLPVLSGEEIPKDGELYHIPYKDGIADDYFSTRWLINRYNRCSTTTTITTIKELIKVSLNNDLVALQTFNKFSENLADFLAPWLKSYNAEAISIGGSISNAWPFFGKSLEKRLRTQGSTVKIYKSDLQEKAILLGSARLINDIFYKGLPF